MQLPSYKQNIGEFENCIKEKDLIIWGCSKAAKEVCCQYKVKYIVDSNDELCDKIVENVKTYQPYKLYAENVENIVILICAAEKYHKEIISEILEIGNFTVFFWNVLSNQFLNKISNELYDNLNKLEEVKSWLEDDLSKKIFQEVVNRRICGLNTGYGDLKVYNEIQYLYMPALMSKKDGIILDLGGYVGDSVDRFVNCLKNDLSDIYTFEALPENIAILNMKKEELSQSWEGNMRVFPYAVADKSGKILFCETEKRGACFSPEFRVATKYSSVSEVKRFSVDAIAIDEVITSSEKIRYIKMDIEGAEYQALLGAKQVIKRDKPGLAISIYHNAVDYFRLAEQIKQFVPEYKLAIRHHKDKHVDTVLYAWI